MGVEGLTTFLREHRFSVAKTVELHKDPPYTNEYVSSEHRNVEIVVDGWSFIYSVYQASHIPWVYGGEYDLFSATIRSTVDAWLSMGANLSFVFDGPFEPHKLATRLARQTNTVVHHGALFFRTSHSTRVTARFLAETRIIPPLVYAACADTLKEMASIFTEGRASNEEERGKGRLDIYYADREADPFMVELAGRLGAYVAALDSDFVIFNMPGYQGYIPLDELEWVYEDGLDIHLRTRTTSLTSSTSAFAPSEISASSDASIWQDIASQAIEEDDGETGFVPVTKKKNKSKATGLKATSTHLHAHRSTKTSSQRSLIPPPSTYGKLTSLVLTVYTPHSVALSLGIPPSLLPLLGAVVGNDITHSAKYALPNTVSSRPPISSSRPGATHHAFLFERKMNAAQRVLYTANTLASVLSNTKRKKTETSDRSILYIIRSMVTTMLLRPRDTTEREIDEIVNRVVEGALLYAVSPSSTDEHTGRAALWPTPFCALHAELEHCRLDALIPEEEGDESGSDDSIEDGVRTRVQTQYLQRYREGSLDANVLDVLVSGSMWPRMFLESPDYTSASGPAEAAGMLRRWVYAILDQGIGVCVRLTPDEEEATGRSEPGGLPRGRAAPEEYGNGPQKEVDVDTGNVDDDDEDEIIDVVDDDDEDSDGVEGQQADPLTALKGALQRLRGEDEAIGQREHLPTIVDEEGDESKSEEDQKREPRFVGEFVRRGARMTEEYIPVDDLKWLLERNHLGDTMAKSATWRINKAHPIQLEEEDMRFDVLLTSCRSDIEKVRQLDKAWTGPVLATRWLVYFAAMKEKERGGDPTTLPPLLRSWSKPEVRALLCAFDPVDASRAAADTSDEPTNAQTATADSVNERRIQLMARALSVIEALRMLIQALGLTARVPLGVQRFKARTFHSLCGEDIGTDEEVPSGLSASVWEAVNEGLQECFSADRVKRTKRKDKDKASSVGKQQAVDSSKTTKGGRFSLLAQLDG